jgi:putative Mn2+ efflux pump MntP
MNFLEILLISLSMSMDAFAVCLGVGSSRRADSPRSRFRLAFHFGFFQFFMPVIGWFAGTTIEHFIAAYDHWVAFGLLGFVGIRMILSGINPEADGEKNDPSRGWSLVLLSLATSIDALAVGFSLGIVGIIIWYPAVVIGVVTGLVSLLGLQLGNRLGEKFGKRMEIAGGIVLVIIGVKILLQHLVG